MGTVTVKVSDLKGDCSVSEKSPYFLIVLYSQECCHY